MMRAMGLRGLLPAAIGIAVATLSGHALATDVEACVAAHSEGQVQANKGKLMDARAQFLFCVSEACPEVVRSECSSLLQELEPKLPTVVLGASTPSGNDETEVEVFVDGVKFAEMLDGRALPIDPGQHELKFRTADGRETTKSVLIREGERARSIVVELPDKRAASVFGSGPSANPDDPAPKAPAVTPAAKPTAEPVPGDLPPEDEPPPADAGGGFQWKNSYTAYVLWGVTAATLGTFIGLGVVGTNEGNACTPRCTDAEVSSVQLKYNVADVMLGASIASAAAGAYFFFFTDDEPASAKAGTTQNAGRRYLFGVRGNF
jgi:hypothetical protein